MHDVGAGGVDMDEGAGWGGGERRRKITNERLLLEMGFEPATVLYLCNWATSSALSAIMTMVVLS